MASMRGSENEGKEDRIVRHYLMVIGDLDRSVRLDHISTVPYAALMP